MSATAERSTLCLGRLELLATSLQNLATLPELEQRGVLNTCGLARDKDADEALSEP